MTGNWRARKIKRAKVERAEVAKPEAVVVRGGEKTAAKESEKSAPAETMDYLGSVKSKARREMKKK